MVITLKKITFDSLPERVHKAIISYENDTIVIDETQLSTEEQLKLKNFFEQDGWKQSGTS